MIITFATQKGGAGKTTLFRLMMGMEKAASELVYHWIGLSGSTGNGEHFQGEDRFKDLCEQKPDKSIY